MHVECGCESGGGGYPPTWLYLPGWGGGGGAWIIVFSLILFKLYVAITFSRKINVIIQVITLLSSPIRKPNVKVNVIIQPDDKTKCYEELCCLATGLHLYHYPAR